MTTENETVKEKTNDKDNMSHILNLKSMFNLHKRKKKVHIIHLGGIN